MLNTAPPQMFCQRRVSGIPFFLSVVVLSCLLTIGCKSSGNKSIIPFFGGGAQVDLPENEFAQSSPPVSPTPPISINDGPGPAIPSTAASSAVTSNQSNAYNPPDMMPAQSATSPAALYARDSMTEVYDIPPGTKTNSGGSAGSLPGTYSGYAGSSTGIGNTSTSSNGFGNSSGAGSRFDYGRTSQSGDTSSSMNDTSSNNSSGYGGSTTDNRYYHGPSTGHTSSLVPTGSHLEDGDYLVDDGSMMRVINGKAYQMVQYFQRTPPIFPDLTHETQSQSTTQPQIPYTSTPVQIATDYRTATQMTESFGKVPIPEYENLLNQQENGFHFISQGIITVASPAATTIFIPDTAPVETVPSLNYSDYSGIGTIKVPPALNHGTNGDIDDPMKNSIWSIMAKQNHNLLLYPQNPK